jgi:transposase
MDARRRFASRCRRWFARHLIFVDECGVNLSQTRAMARAPIGERAVDAVPGRRWENYSVIAGLTLEGMVAPMVLPGAMNSCSLRAWTRELLVPRLKPGDIVVWDNLGIHNDTEVRALITRRGARLVFLPPYSPDLNPIEEAWSKVKSILRAAKARVYDALVDALDAALSSVDIEDCRGWFQHAGYRVT